MDTLSFHTEVSNLVPDLFGFGRILLSTLLTNESWYQDPGDPSQKQSVLNVCDIWIDPTIFDGLRFKRKMSRVTVPRRMQNTHTISMRRC